MTQLGLDYSRPLARNTDPDTSHAAAERIAPRAGSIAWRVVEALRAAALHHPSATGYDCPRSGLTAPEIAHHLGKRDGSISPRMPRLEEKGLVRVLKDEHGKELWRDKARIWVAC